MDRISSSFPKHPVKVTLRWIPTNSMKIVCLKYSAIGLVTFTHASLSHYHSSCDHMFKDKFLFISVVEQGP